MNRTARLRRATVPAALARLAALAALAVLAGCVDTEGDSPAGRDEVRDALARDVPEVTVEDVRASTALGSPLSLSVIVRGPEANPDDVRRRTRQVARTVWFAAPQRLERIQVSHATAGWVDELDLPSDAAQRVWGPAAGRDRPPNDRGTSCGSGPDLQAIDGRLSFTGIQFGSTDVRVRASLPGTPAAAEVEAVVDRLARFAWRCHPDRITRLAVEVRTDGGQQTGPAPLAAAADELRTRYGPRPDDLPQ